MLKKELHKDTGIALLMAAFFLAWAAAGLPALAASVL